MDPRTSYDSLQDDLRDLYKFDPKEKFTLKWIDEEGKWHNSELFNQNAHPQCYHKFVGYQIYLNFCCTQD